MRAIKVILLSIGLIGPLSIHSIHAHGATVSAPIGQGLVQAKAMAQAGKYPEAMKVIAGLDAMPNKTSDETTAVSQMRTFVTVKMQGR